MRVDAVGEGESMPPSKFGANAREEQTIEHLLEKHGDVTVELYGDATSEALSEYPERDVPPLLATIEPIATVNLSNIQRPNREQDGDAFDPEQCMNALQEGLEPPDPATVEASEAIRSVCESNAVIISHEPEDE